MADITTFTQIEKRATPPVQMFYCSVCTFPPEYCEFGNSLSKCKEWLQTQRPDLYEKFYSEEALKAKLGTISQEAQSKLEEDTAKKEAKAEAKADAARKKKLASQVVIKRIERNKRKFVTSIRGLEAFGVDLKKAAKLFAQRFATGGSVTKNAAGIDEIVVQGDVSQEIYDMIAEANEGGGEDGKGGKKGVDILKGVLIDNVDIVEEKRKKDSEQ
ncbi:translation initiation factor SUI1 [Multifurca ochricompacta]|uniref:Translation machinery-associated protein 22 n=1 Tax=Multifurca ochricompacta TaxID=376703 RepID=A0AAD4MBB8_9AGAM|nr:translation initiation factor SUI1 [Multifurca ochricompacta]